MLLWISVAVNLSKALKAHIESMKRLTANKNMLSNVERPVHGQDVRLRFTWDALVGTKDAYTHMSSSPIITYDR